MGQNEAAGVIKKKERGVEGGGGGRGGGKGGIVTSGGISKGYPSPVFVNRDTRQLRGAVTVIGWVVFAGSMDQSKHRYASPLSLSLSLVPLFS